MKKMKRLSVTKRASVAVLSLILMLSSPLTVLASDDADLPGEEVQNEMAPDDEPQAEQSGEEEISGGNDTATETPVEEAVGAIENAEEVVVLEIPAEEYSQIIDALEKADGYLVDKDAEGNNTNDYYENATEDLADIAEVLPELPGDIENTEKDIDAIGTFVEENSDHRCRHCKHSRDL